MVSSRRTKLAIIHFNPIEKYPPTLNWIDFLSENKSEELTIEVYTFAPEKSFQRYTEKQKSLRIIRSSTLSSNSFVRRTQYIIYYVRTIIHLLLFRPEIVFYYESLSAIPAIFYKRFINRKASIVTHYHEYTTKEEYASGMWLEKWAHRWEQTNYYLYKWISHTNEQRLKLFSDDNANLTLPPQHIYPNYPPVAWKKSYEQKSRLPVVRFVLVGAIDIDTMYVKEFSEWIISLKGRAIWDIYTSNISSETLSYIRNLESDYIKVKGAVLYYDLPDVFEQYDVGIILYKGKIKNFIYVAPNKLFEYYACNLDVWFPIQMVSSQPYIKTNSSPGIQAVDFSRMDAIDLNRLVDHGGHEYRPSNFYSDLVHPTMYKNLFL